MSCKGLPHVNWDRPQFPYNSEELGTKAINECMLSSVILALNSTNTYVYMYILVRSVDRMSVMNKYIFRKKCNILFSCVSFGNLDVFLCSF